MKKKFIGILLAVCGNSLISFSLNAQKYAHMQNQQRPENLRVSYLKLKWWWIGMIMMGLGELGNFLAFGFAPASLVSPLGGVSVIANAFIASGLLGEILLVRDVIGTFLALWGGVIIVIFAPEDDPNITLPILLEYALSTEFLMFLSIILISVAFLMSLPKEYADQHLIVNILICSLLGCITVMTCKGISLSIFLTMEGDNQFKYPFIYVLLGTAVLTIIFQIRHLNEAMKLFGTAQVVPVYYVLFTTCAIMGGMVLYKEFLNLSPQELMSFIAGCCVTFVGIFVITANRKTRAVTMEAKDHPLIDSTELDTFIPEGTSTHIAVPTEELHGDVNTTTVHDAKVTNQNYQKLQDFLNTPLAAVWQEWRAYRSIH